MNNIKRHIKKSIYIRNIVCLVVLLVIIIASIKWGGNNDVSLEVSSMKILDYYEQMGIDTETPEFSWKLSAKNNGAKQVAYQIMVSNDLRALRLNHGNMWDSGKVESEEIYGILYNGKSLLSNTEYFWKVRVWNENGIVSEWSSICKFVTGFMKNVSWKAEWIGNGTLKPYYARKVEDVCEKKIKSAYAFVSGLGQFKFFINGEKVGNHELDPGWTDYADRIQYVVFDVKDLIVPGKNAFGLSVGNGWYSRDTGERHYYIDYLSYGNMLPAIAEIHIAFEDGTSQIITTDTSWSTRSSATTVANVYGSEDFDARLYPDGWNTIEFSEIKDKTAEPWQLAQIATDCSKDVLAPMTQPPVVVQKLYETQKITEYDGKILFDLGQNMSGIFEVYAKGPAGAKIKVMPVEKLVNGKADAVVSTWSYYTLKGTGEIEVFRPDFSYAGGRWVEISIEETDDSVVVTRDEADEDNVFIQDVKGYFITTAAAETGYLKTSDVRYERVSELVNSASESNLIHVHTDCPTIEKMGWLETTHLMHNGISYTKDMREFWRKVVTDSREAQRDDGMIPTVAPSYNGHYFGGRFQDSPVWSATNVLATYYNYIMYDDVQLIVNNFESMKAYLSYTKSKINKDGLLEHGLGDWGSPRYNTNNVNAISVVDPGNVDTGYYYFELTAMAQMCDRIGKYALAKEYKTEADHVKENYNNKLLEKDELTGNYYYKRYDTEVAVITDDYIIQVNQAIPIYFGLVPEQYRSSVFNSMMLDIEKNGITCGEVGLKPVLQVLSQYGRDDMIEDLIVGNEHPSYIRFLDKGETTLPEFWTDTARSRNHDMLGTIQQYFYDGLGGILPITPGYKKIKIQPGINSDLRSAFIIYDSIRGEICSEWKVIDGKLELNVSIPPSSTAEVWLPIVDIENPTITVDEKIVYKENASVNSNLNIDFVEKGYDAGGYEYLVFNVQSGKYDFMVK